MTTYRNKHRVEAWQFDGSFDTTNGFRRLIEEGVKFKVEDGRVTICGDELHNGDWIVDHIDEPEICGGPSVVNNAEFCDRYEPDEPNLFRDLGAIVTINEARKIADALLERFGASLIRNVGRVLV